MSTVDLASLPAPEVIQALSFEAILEQIVADYVTRYPDAVDSIQLESDPVRKLLETVAYRELALRARYNDEARALLLAFSTGSDLDHIGATYYQEHRLVITPENLSVSPPVAAVLESGSDYRQRLALKPESWSVAGPTNAYKWHAISTDGAIKDASVTCPQGGTTQVYILNRSGNGIPTAGQLQAVRDKLNSDDIRPLSEEVLVSAPAIVNYSLDVALTLYPGPSTEIVTAAVQSALSSFATTRHMLDADIIRSAIDAAAHVSGVKKVTINAPAADVVCGKHQAPFCTGISIAIAGIES